MAIEVKENVPLASHTIYKIGGPARYYVETKSGGDVRDACVYAAQKNVPFFIMGAGSNVLVSDAGYEGMVIRMIGGEVRAEGERLVADAGIMMARAVTEAARHALTGFEWGIGVPGTIGGSVRGNAGCFGGEMKDVVERVDVFDTALVKHRMFDKDACAFGYRDSIFKKHPEWVVLSATLKLAPGDPTAIQERIRTITAERLSKQAIGTKSCGCIFKNIPWPDDERARDDLVSRFPELAACADRPAIPASLLIDRAGLKGAREGNIIVSLQHANFFVNEGEGTAADVVRLVARAREEVYRRYGFELREEIQHVGF